jgi:OmpA-OmpF porin, OOP family
MRPATKQRWLGLALAACLVGAMPVAVQAQSANDIIRSLAPIAGQSLSTEGRRSVPYLDRQGRSTTVTLDYRYAIDMTVFFRYNSAELTERARLQLAGLGRALQSERLRPHRYMIAGHTDAVGSDDFNRDLSFRRADAVAAYLNKKFSVDPRRLIVTGWGASQLKAPREPTSATNRRVELVLVAEPAPATSIAPRSSNSITETQMKPNCTPEMVRANPGKLDDFEACRASPLTAVPSSTTPPAPPATGARTTIDWK